MSSLKRITHPELFIDEHETKKTVVDGNIATQLSTLKEQMFALIDEYATFESKLALSTPWRGETTHMDATTESITHRLLKFLEPKIVETFVHGIRERLMQSMN
jgi:hypothetical protein